MQKTGKYLKQEDLYHVAKDENEKYIMEKYEKFKKNVQNEELIDTVKMTIKNEPEKFIMEDDKKTYKNIRNSRNKLYKNSYVSNQHLVLMQQIKGKIIFYAFLAIIANLFQFLGPYCMGNLMSFINSDDSYWVGVGFSTLLLFGFLFRTIFLQQCFYILNKVAIEIMVILRQHILNKIVNIKQCNMKYYSVAKIINMMNSDVDNIQEFLQGSSFLFSAPLMILISIIYLYFEIGVYVFMALGFLVVLVIIQSFLNKKSFSFLRQTLNINDQRNSKIIECFTNIKHVKFNALEQYFNSQIKDLRKQEINKYMKYYVYRSIIDTVGNSIPLVLTGLVLTVYISQDETLSDQQALIILTLLNIILVPFHLLIMMIQKYFSSRLSYRRIIQFLKQPIFENISIQDKCIRGKIEINNLTTTYDHPLIEYLQVEDNQILNTKYDTKLNNVLKEQQKCVSNINIHIQPKQLTMVVGEIGSGKSSLIHSILKQTYIIEGDVSICGSVGYISQFYWLMNNTIKENIVFYEKYDEKWYLEVVDKCELISDFNELNNGDQTIVGESGINLSGGQKQRIQIARAVYAKKDIYIIDDCFSALDQYVGQNIFNHVIKGILKDKTILLITHAIHYLDQADHIIVMNKGTIQMQGTFVDLCKDNQFFQQYGLSSKNKITDAENDQESLTKQETQQVNKVIKQKQKQEEEQSIHGSIPIKTYFNYIKNGGLFLFVIVILIFISNKFFKQFIEYIIIQWSRSTRGEDYYYDNNFDTKQYWIVFFVFLLVQIIIMFLQNNLFYIWAMKSSNSYHIELIKILLKTPLQWYDNTPSARIITRTTSDQNQIDSELPFQIFFIINNLIQLLVVVITVIVILPFVLLVYIPLFYFFSVFIRMYSVSSREISRILQISRSPISTHMQETLSGIEIITAFGKIDNFINKYKELQYRFILAFSNKNYTMRWISMVVDNVVLILIISIAYFGVFTKEVDMKFLNPETIGLLLVWNYQLLMVMPHTIKLIGQVESDFTSIIRMIDYIENNPQEKDHFEPKPIEGFMENYNIYAKNIYFRYKENLPDVIKGISFEIKQNEKVGVIGRTGSGKSTLMQGLMRLIELQSGQIFIGDQDISNLGLNHLRSNMQIIPQDPILFKGTLRSNLDPFNKFTDQKILEVLKSLNCYNMFINKNLTGLSEDDQVLYYDIYSNGSNLSQGQRQLVNISKTFLQSPKILLIDEATASIDEQNDDLIQKNMKEQFVNSTVITIAHRLNTIIQYDKILVLEQGHIQEFDCPIKLLNDENSFLYELTNKVSRNYYLKLKQMAENK